ncbi:MAG TPA: hypothetical protein VGH38_27090 [Bryobacteraceae bacterium]|jgi:hypothetical protein
MMPWILGPLLLAVHGSANAAALSFGVPLPKLKGTFLNGKTAVLPDAASGRVALLLVGFTYDSRFAVEAWAGQFRRRFEAEPRVTFYEIPMVGGLATLGKWFIDSGMRRGTPKEDYEHVITVYGGTASWKQRLGYGDPKAAYVILLDGAGKVAWRYAGGFDEQAFQSLSSEVAALLRNPILPSR